MVITLPSRVPDAMNIKIVKTTEKMTSAYQLIFAAYSNENFFLEMKYKNTKTKSKKTALTHSGGNFPLTKIVIAARKLATSGNTIKINSACNKKLFFSFISTPPK